MLHEGKTHGEMCKLRIHNHLNIMAKALVKYLLVNKFLRYVLAENKGALMT